MLRRSFRRGLGLGLLIGAAIAVYRTLEARRGVAAPTPQPWTPVSAPPVAESVQAPPRAESEEAATDVETFVRDETPDPLPAPTDAPAPPDPLPATPPPDPPMDEVGEPIMEPPAGAPPRPQSDDITPTDRQRARRAARKAPAKKAASTPWVDPEGRMCPPSHPVKGKLASRIFHVPGGFNYERTVPDRCYRDAATAEGDGLRQSKR